MSTVAWPVKMMTWVSGLTWRIWPEDLDTGQAGHAEIEQRRVIEALLESPQGGGAVGADGDFMSQPGQLHLHQVPQVGFIVGEKNPQSSLTRLFHRTFLWQVRGPRRCSWPETAGTSRTRGAQSRRDFGRIDGKPHRERRALVHDRDSRP